jgi:hypothetical protein
MPSKYVLAIALLIAAAATAQENRSLTTSASPAVDGQPSPPVLPEPTRQQPSSPPVTAAPAPAPRVPSPLPTPQHCLRILDASIDTDPAYLYCLEQALGNRIRRAEEGEARQKPAQR